jgi:aspartokinase/homoserine dehydrogenase 1
MKFGGTSVADASCIQGVAKLIKAASKESDIVVVVSAMSGVTNKLIQAATGAELGNRSLVEGILGSLRDQHVALLSSLVRSLDVRTRIEHRMLDLLQECEELFRSATLSRQLTLPSRDFVISLGERLCAPVVASFLAQEGIASEAVEATELVITDAYHGAAEPQMDLTRKSCQERLNPLLQRGVAPVVTGFIGATLEGALTTLGRGGSDYSATILAAALDADEVIIWKDVDGLHTADPRLVSDASAIPEISYREAAELAYFGAKVLHPKALSAIMRCGIPLWIRNTFAPERPGTKITASGPQNISGSITALAAISDVALITVRGHGTAGVSEFFEGIFAAGLRADFLLISQSSSPDDTSLVVSAPLAHRTVELLRGKFARPLTTEKVEHILLDTTLAVVSAVGRNMRNASNVIARTMTALNRKHINITHIAQGTSPFTLSFLVAKSDMKTALAVIHQEFQLSGTEFARTIRDRPDETPVNAA